MYYNLLINNKNRKIMAKAKQERADLTALLSIATGGQVAQQTPAQQPAVDIIETAQAEPMLKFDKEDELKKIRKRCRNTIKEIAKAVLPASVLKTTAMMDKIESDAMSMVGLYWQLRISEIMQEGITDSISKGNMSPRMIEVFTQLVDKISQLNKQVIATEVQMRKNYLDFKTDMIEKTQEETMKQQQLSGNNSVSGKFLTKGTKNMISKCKGEIINSAVKGAEDTSYVEIK